MMKNKLFFFVSYEGTEIGKGKHSRASFPPRPKSKEIWRTTRPGRESFRRLGVLTQSAVDKMQEHHRSESAGFLFRAT